MTVLPFRKPRTLAELHCERMRQKVHRQLFEDRWLKWMKLELETIVEESVEDEMAMEAVL